MKKKITDTCLLELKVGDVIQERSGKERVGILHGMHLVPNNNKPNSELVCIVVMLYIDPDKGPIKISSTSNHFKACEKYEYDEYYPSQM